MRRSTGPRTQRGKARSSQNSARHWVESKRILPNEQPEAAKLRSGFEDDLKPQTLIEHEIIDDLVLNRLIKRRIDVAFTRKSSNALIETTTKELDRDEHVAAQYWLRLAGLGNEYRTDGEQAERLQPDGCISIVKQLQCRIRESGVQPREDLAVICAAYGLQPTLFAAKAMYQLLSLYLKKTEQDKTAEMKDDAGHKKEILETLESDVQRHAMREKLEKLIFEDPSNIQEPLRPELETLLRYRAANTREFKDLLDSLERIRRLRQSAA